MSHGLSVPLLILYGFVLMAVQPMMSSSHFGQGFNTMTPYFWTTDRNSNSITNESLIQYDGKTCNMVGLNILLRHGARHPTLYWIKRMKSFHKRVFRNPNVGSKNILLKNWSIPFPEDKEYSQSARGDEEMLLLGKAFGTLFDDLSENSLEQIRFAVTNRAITHESFKMFAKGLSKITRVNFTNTKPKMDDERLHFFTKCRKHNKMTKILDYEYSKFLKSSAMKSVQRRIGFKLGKNVSPEQVLTMHQICAFELGIFNTSDWCSFFTKQDLRVIDYLLDIMVYWHRGYGYQLNYNMACPFTSHLFNAFDHAVNITEQNATRSLSVADVQFAHSHTLIPVISAFGLFKDAGQLLASNIDANTNRTFKMSKVCPFSANLAILLYKCGQSDFVVKMFVNERVVYIPACESTVCSYKIFRSFYNSLTVCSFNEICDIVNR